MLRNGDGLPLEVRKCPGAIDDMEVVSLVITMTGFYALTVWAVRFRQWEMRHSVCWFGFFAVGAFAWDATAMDLFLLPLFRYVLNMHYLPLKGVMACWVIFFWGVCVKNTTRNLWLLARKLRGGTRWQLENVASDAVCSVCLEPANAACRLTSCGHVFCRGCIVAWLDRSGTCPNCRVSAQMFA